MMKSILLATIALVMMGGSAQTQTLTSSGPITVTTAGTVIENLRITANGQRCITVNNAPDVILRNIECRHVNEAGVKAFNVTVCRLLISTVSTLERRVLTQALVRLASTSKVPTMSPSLVIVLGRQ
jgi:hypothetical protein